MLWLLNQHQTSDNILYWSYHKTLAPPEGFFLAISYLRIDLNGETKFLGLDIVLFIVSDERMYSISLFECYCWLRYKNVFLAFQYLVSDNALKSGDLVMFPIIWAYKEESIMRRKTCQPHCSHHKLSVPSGTLGFKTSMTLQKWIISRRWIWVYLHPYGHWRWKQTFRMTVYS